MNFLQAWTIWEHLYALNHKDTLNDAQIYNTSANKKIDYILTHYFDITTTLYSKNKVDKLVKARNRIIHFGKHPTNLTSSEIETFMRATEALVAMTLDLTPNNVFNYQEKLDLLLFS